MGVDEMSALIVPGRLLLLHCSFTKPKPKDKFFLTVATEPWLIGFLINSDLTPFQKEREDRRADLLPVGPNRILHKQSWLDCSCPIEEIELADACAQIDADPARVKPMATDQLMAAVRGIVDRSLLIEAGCRKIILRRIDEHFPATGNT